MSPSPSRPDADYFVPPASIVRRIWGSADTVLFVFAGAAAEYWQHK